jgi:hypothetical protein
MVKFTSLFALASIFATGFAATTPKGCSVSESLLAIIGGSYVLESAINDLPDLAPAGDKGVALDTAAKSLHLVISAAAATAKQSAKVSTEDATTLLANFAILEKLIDGTLANIRSKRPVFGSDLSGVESDLQMLYNNHLEFSAALTALFPASLKTDSDAVLAQFEIIWKETVAYYKS